MRVISCLSRSFGARVLPQTPRQGELGSGQVGHGSRFLQILLRQVQLSALIIGGTVSALFKRILLDGLMSHT